MQGFKSFISSNSLNFKGTMNSVNCSNPSTGDVVYDSSTGKIYVYTLGSWECISESEDKESKIINLECKHCGSSSFTKIRPRNYKCNYCDSILISFIEG